MHTRMKISGFVRGFIIGALGTVALMVHGIIPQAQPDVASVLDDPAIIIVDADFSSYLAEPAMLSEGATIPIDVLFE
jgi:hypothetical protein